MKRKYICLLFTILGILTQLTNSAEVITETRTGQIDGYNYELWKDRGTTSMTLLGGGKFSCSWS